MAARGGHGWRREKGFPGPWLLGRASGLFGMVLNTPWQFLCSSSAFSLLGRLWVPSQHPLWHAF